VSIIDIVNKNYLSVSRSLCSVTVQEKPNDTYAASSAVTD